MNVYIIICVYYMICILLYIDIEIIDLHNKNMNESMNEWTFIIMHTNLCEHTGKERIVYNDMYSSILLECMFMYDVQPL